MPKKDANMDLVQSSNVRPHRSSHLPLQEQINLALRRHRAHPMKLSILAQTLHIIPRFIRAIPLHDNPRANLDRRRHLELPPTAHRRIRERRYQGRADQLDGDQRVLRYGHLVYDFDVVDCGGLCVEDGDALREDVVRCLGVEPALRDLFNSGVVSDSDGGVEAARSKR